MGSLVPFTISGIIEEISFFHLVLPKSNKKQQKDCEMGMKATADIFYSAPLLSAHRCGRYLYPARATFSGAPRLHLGHAAKIFNFWISLWTEETLSASVASHSCEENELTLYSTVPLPSLDGEHHSQSIQTATPSILNLT